MKRIGQIALTLILVFLIPAGIASGQEKKEEKHIKVIVSDKGGENIIIDTTITSTDANGSKTVKIVRGEPVIITHDSDGEKVVIVSSGSHVSGDQGEHVTSWTASSAGEHGNVIYINEGKDDLKDGEIKYNVEVRKDESGTSTEKSSYVIAKDGMVVTIEGDSEEKVKEIASIVESKLGVSKNGKSTKTEVIKEETKSTTKSSGKK